MPDGTSAVGVIVLCGSTLEGILVGSACSRPNSSSRPPCPLAGVRLRTLSNRIGQLGHRIVNREEVHLEMRVTCIAVP
jgi:hypothetical protein